MSARQRLVRAWETGDLTQSEFARKHGIPYGTLRNWIGRHGDSPTLARPEPPIRFEEIRLPIPGPVGAGSCAAPWEAEVRFPSGLVVALAPGMTVARVRELMEALGC